MAANPAGQKQHKQVKIAAAVQSRCGTRFITCGTEPG